MFWLKAGHDFYNLDRISKIDYSFNDDGAELIVNIYSDVAGKPLCLKDRRAAQFLDNISRMEGCWAFGYSDDETKKIDTLLGNNPSFIEEEANEIGEEDDFEENVDSLAVSDSLNEPDSREGEILGQAD